MKPGYHALVAAKIENHVVVAGIAAVASACSAVAAVAAALATIAVVATVAAVAVAARPCARHLHEHGLPKDGGPGVQR